MLGTPIMMICIISEHRHPASAIWRLCHLPLDGVLLFLVPHSIHVLPADFRTASTRKYDGHAFTLNAVPG